MSIIYQLVSPSGKSYIGRHRYDDPARRFAQHEMAWKRWVRNGRPRKSYLTKLFYAFDKYPPQTWSINILITCAESELGFLENSFIKKHNSIANGYNLTEGGGLLNLTLSEEHRAKQSESRKKFWDSPEGELQKKLASERAKNHNPGAEALRGKIAWNRGIPHSEEHRKKISERGKGQKRPKTEEHRKKISEAKLGKYTEKQKAAAIQNGLNRIGFIQTEKQKKAAADANSQQWLVTDPYGKIHKVFNLNLFCRENGLTQSNITRGGSKGWKAVKDETS